MPTLNFLKGLESDLPSSKNDNNIYITTDKGDGYLGDKQLWITPDELNEKIGDINSILDNINGEII